MPEPMSPYRNGKAIGGALSDALLSVVMAIVVWHEQTWWSWVVIAVAAVSGTGACRHLGRQLAKPCAPVPDPERTP